MAKDPAAGSGDRYRWVALANTTAAMFVFAVAAALAAVAALASLLRGGRYVPPEPGPRRPHKRPQGTTTPSLPKPRLVHCFTKRFRGNVRCGGGARYGGQPELGHLRRSGGGGTQARGGGQGGGDAGIGEREAAR